MLKPHELGGVHKSFRIMKIVGDWLILRLQYHDEVLVTKNYVTFYNLQTGEIKTPGLLDIVVPSRYTND